MLHLKRWRLMAHIHHSPDMLTLPVLGLLAAFSSSATTCMPLNMAAAIVPKSLLQALTHTGVKKFHRVRWMHQSLRAVRRVLGSSGQEAARQ